MEEKEFIKKAMDLIYKETAKNSNLILGKNKTASLSTGLFLKLPIEVVLTKSYEPMPKLDKQLNNFMNFFGAYTNLDNTTKVFFTFMYHDEKDLKMLMNHLPRHGVFLAFVYIHEVQHIIRKHITTSYDTMMKRIAGDAVNAHHLVNIAEDHAINYSIKDLFMMSSSTVVKNAWAEIESIGYYDTRYHTEQMSDIDILKDMIESGQALTVEQLSDMLEKVTQGGKESLQPTEAAKNGSTGDSSSDDSSSSEGSGNESNKGKIDKCSTVADDLDNALSDLSESLQDIIRTNTRGTQQGEHFEKEFEAIKVETGWFKKIKASFKRQVYYKTHDYSTNWANMNNTYRRIYKSPKKQFIDDKIHIILSTDHSGSMGVGDLQKLLYLIESEATRIAKVTVIIHDTTVVNSFELENEYDITKDKNFKKALATRYTVGGTSHACVFEHIQNMKIQDHNKVIYMSFSDNYSDIEEVFSSYPVMRRLTNYWVRASGKPVEAPGTNISMI